MVSLSLELNMSVINLSTPIICVLDGQRIDGKNNLSLINAVEPTFFLKEISKGYHVCNFLISDRLMLSICPSYIILGTKVSHTYWLIFCEKWDKGVYLYVIAFNQCIIKRLSVTNIMKDISTIKLSVRHKITTMILTVIHKEMSMFNWYR